MIKQKIIAAATGLPQLCEYIAKAQKIPDKIANFAEPFFIILTKNKEERVSPKSIGVYPAKEMRLRGNDHGKMEKTKDIESDIQTSLLYSYTRNAKATDAIR